MDSPHLLENVVQAVVGDGDHNALGAASGEGCPRRPCVGPAGVRRLLVETVGMTEVLWGGEGAAGGVELIAAAGVLRVSEGAKGRAIVCLNGVELHSATGVARVTTKSTEHVLAESIQTEVVEGIRQSSTRAL